MKFHGPGSIPDQSIVNDVNLINGEVDMRSNPWLLTASGRHFPLLNPTTADVALQDIAHALGHLCRFTGHTKRIYTVAEHCVLVALILREQGHDTETQLLGLLHDAAEAYVGDLSSPLKWAMDACMGPYPVSPHIGTWAFREVENRVVNVILAAFGLAGYNFGGVVKEADLIAGITEARDLLGSEVMTTFGPQKPYHHNIEIALLWAQWLYTHDLDVVLSPAALYKAVFASLVRGA